ncbi:amino acid ABC transporter substrate-binding protein [Oenococcus oeni]|uniref:amino acid ABC transporter substrate-binding protein n=1 Tax=Oenococcus oeni TaxID=1247 RepID=UPI00050E6529|nr:amino acid ABC transporter substrate-binding protein [Oenococcus oeni]AVI94806.1 amino acid ABC transporter substrate-binding protein [Oenococcus oeni]KGH89731.1 amino acid ABC transporter substrate-binding protein [Oenococcus oeni S12]OIL19127.1 amino acid ABC transporter substrate-binding protein [Oenococcus oeni]OIL22911.1 amino acid ABC transporter substrate-binding protein [Oenococcus oeni]OIL37432.1 amino acid ABC transporter substrate-binding protein [Oenococcus oeni]
MTANDKKKAFINIGIIVLIIAIIAGGWTYFANKTKTKSSDHWYRIKKSKKIKIGLDDTFIPMGFRNKSGKLIGFDVDLANATFKKLGIKVEWEPINWSTKEQLLNDGQIDAIWNGYTISAARKKKVAFSIPYKKGTQVLVTLSKDKINSFADMKGKTLGLQNGSTAQTQFQQYKNLLKKYVKGTPQKYDTFDKAFMDLKAGRIQGILVDSMYAGYYVKHLSDSQDYKIIYGGYPTDENGVGFRKSDVKLREEVNTVLKKFQQNGKMKSLQEKWFGKADSGLK